MAADKARAIVLRTFPFGDTSSVVTLFTRECGKVRALAKGAWRPKGGFDAALDLLSICQVLVLRKTSGGLDLLTEAFLEHRFRVGGSQAAFLGGMHVADLLDGLTAEGDPLPELFDLATATLRILSAPVPVQGDSHDRLVPRTEDPGGTHPGAVPPDVPDACVPRLVTQAELAMLRLVGHAPALDRCAECRGAVTESGRTAFGMLDGGLLCGRCRRGKRAVVAVSAGGLATLRLLAGAGDAWRSIDPAAAVDAEVRAVMTTLFSHLLGKRPRVAPLLAPARPAAGRRFDHPS